MIIIHDLGIKTKNVNKHSFTAGINKNSTQRLIHDSHFTQSYEFIQAALKRLIKFKYFKFTTSDFL